MRLPRFLAPLAFAVVAGTAGGALAENYCIVVDYVHSKEAAANLDKPAWTAPLDLRIRDEGQVALNCPGNVCYRGAIVAGETRRHCAVLSLDQQAGVAFGVDLAYQAGNAPGECVINNVLPGQRVVAELVPSPDAGGGPAMLRCIKTN